MSEESLLERATRNNFGHDPYQIAPNTLGHRLRLSDASSFDVVCVCCGGTDRAGSAILEQPCASPLPARG